MYILYNKYVQNNHQQSNMSSRVQVALGTGQTEPERSGAVGTGGNSFLWGDIRAIYVVL